MVCGGNCKCGGNCRCGKSAEQKFRHKKTGEIATQISLLDIKNWEKLDAESFSADGKSKSGECYSCGEKGIHALSKKLTEDGNCPNCGALQEICDECGITGNPDVGWEGHGGIEIGVFVEAYDNEGKRISPKDAPEVGEGSFCIPCVEKWRKMGVRFEYDDEWDAESFNTEPYGTYTYANCPYCGEHKPLQMDRGSMICYECWLNDDEWEAESFGAEKCDHGWLDNGCDMEYHDGDVHGTVNFVCRYCGQDRYVQIEQKSKLLKYAESFSAEERKEKQCDRCNPEKYRIGHRPRLTDEDKKDRIEVQYFCPVGMHNWTEWELKKWDYNADAEYTGNNPCRQGCTHACAECCGCGVESFSAEIFEARYNQDGTIVLTDNEWNSCLHMTLNNCYLWGNKALFLEDEMKSGNKFKVSETYTDAQIALIRRYEGIFRAINRSKRKNAESFSAEKEKRSKYMEFIYNMFYTPGSDAYKIREERNCGKTRDGTYRLASQVGIAFDKRQRPFDSVLHNNLKGLSMTSQPYYYHIPYKGKLFVFSYIVKGRGRLKQGYHTYHPPDSQFGEEQICGIETKHGDDCYCYQKNYKAESHDFSQKSAESFSAKEGFDRNCKVCKGTGWMPKKGDPKEDAELAKLFGVGIDELVMQPCNAGGKDMGCFGAESFAAEMMECGNCDETFTIDEGLDIGGIDYCEECYDTISAKDLPFGAEHNQTRFYRNLGVGAALVAGLAYWFKR